MNKNTLYTLKQYLVGTLIIHISSFKKQAYISCYYEFKEDLYGSAKEFRHLASECGLSSREIAEFENNLEEYQKAIQDWYSTLTPRDYKEIYDDNNPYIDPKKGKVAPVCVTDKGYYWIEYDDERYTDEYDDDEDEDEDEDEDYELTADDVYEVCFEIYHHLQSEGFYDKDIIKMAKRKNAFELVDKLVRHDHSNIFSDQEEADAFAEEFNDEICKTMIDLIKDPPMGF